MKILLIDSDEDFRKKFSDYIVGNYEDIILTAAEVKAEDINTITDMFFENDIVIADERARMPEIVPQGYEGRCVVLTVGEQGGGFSEQDGNGINMNCLHVYKFQSMPDILKCIPEFKLNSDRKITGGRSNYHMEVIAVSGFSGGCGKTSFAVMLARLNQNRFKKRTLIISLASVSDINDYFPQNSGNTAEYFCDEQTELNEGGNDLNMLFLNFLAGISVNENDFLVKDRFGVNTFISPRGLMSDIVEFGEKHIGEFINYIEKTGMFDTVIFDMDSRISAGNTAVYKTADRVFIISRENRFRVSSEVYWEELVFGQCKDRGFVKVMNFCGEVRRTESIMAEDEIYIDRESDFKLPFDPDSFFVREGGLDISMVGGYAAAAGYLADEAMAV